MKYHVTKTLALLLMSLAATKGSNAQQKATLQRPKLVVGIVVDQMRWDYLYRYYDRYSDGGFKRMMGEGFNCQQTFINYMPAFTAPGHATIYTGTTPLVHGIVANDWVDVATGKKWYCAQDPNVTPVGGSARAGKMSPANMISSTITDELRLATNMQSKVFGIAIKDRGSILPAGHIANGAYWFDDSTGNFMSSSYYGKQLPQWLNEFNAKRYPDSMIAKDWTLLYPANTYTQSLPDNNRYEGKFAGEAAPVFPHSVAGLRNKGYFGLRYLPAGNTLTLKAARACIKGEAMGRDNVTDFLCVSFSSTDYSGHQFASNSVEMEDMYLRLDKDLASFMRFLDNNVGAGNYTMFLTADHGAAHNPMYLEDLKIPAGNTPVWGVSKELKAFTKQQFGSEDIVKALMNYQVYLNEELIAERKLNLKAVKEGIIKWFETKPGIALALDATDMGMLVVPDAIRRMVVNGHNKKRSGQIQLIMEPGWFSDSDQTGTTHGTWHPYDTHIPLLWYGWGIPHGETARTINMTDIAPTLANLLHIQMPNGCTGTVITEIKK